MVLDADTQRFANVVVGNQYTDPAFLEKADDLLDVEHGDRIYASEGFVKQNETWPGGQRTCDLDSSPLPTRKRSCGVQAEVTDVQLFEQAFRSSFNFVRRQRLQFEHGLDVFADRQLAKNGSLLWQIREPQSGTPVNRQMRELHAVEMNVTAITSDQTDHHVETGCLAGAVGTEQADDFAAD